MSLAAIPAYFLARRHPAASASPCSPPALTVLVPAMLYTGELMTENAFYPIFLLTALVLVITLEQPTASPAGRPARALRARVRDESAGGRALRGSRDGADPARRSSSGAGCAGRCGRSHGSTASSAPARSWRSPATVARGRSPLTLLGAYRAATSASYTPRGVLHFFLYHVAGLDLALGILPFAALLAMWLAPRRPTPAARAFTVASLAVSVWLLAEVSAFASASYVDRIEERNIFYLAPFALIALLGLGRRRRSSRAPRRPVVAAAVVAGVLPVLHPVRPLHRRRARSSTPSRCCRGGGRRTT